MKFKQVLDIKKSILDLLKNNIKSILMISLLVLKYFVLCLLTRYYHFEQNDNLVLISFVSLLIIDSLVLVKEKNIIFKKKVNLLKYLINYMSLSIVFLDCSLLISYLVGDKYTVMFMRVVSILLYIYILIDFMLLPTKISKLKKNESFLFGEKVKVIIFYWLALGIFYCILNSYEEIFIPIFSGVIYVFLKWFYSKDFIQYMRAKTENEFEISEEEFGISEERFEISEELEKSNAIKSSNITILFTAINLSALTKKICESQFKFISDKLIGLTKLNLANNVMSNLIVVVLVTILFFVIKIIIYKKGVSIIEKYKIKQKYRIEISN